jgi:GrpB-like predicted nucleotidyltransferase (UPF0157 family)
MVKLERQNFKKNKKLYNSIACELAKKFGKDVPIEHVDSTAIPNCD